MLRDLPLPTRLLATWFLVVMAAGFVAAQVNLHIHHGNADGESGLALSDVVAAFHGVPGASLLTAKISPGGSMARRISTPADRQTIVDWVIDGASEPAFAPVREVLNRSCVRCHRPGGKMQQVPFGRSREQGAEFGLVKPLTTQSSGMSWGALARSSHAHLFGLGTLFAIAGFVFLRTGASNRVKACVISTPFVALLCDVGSWWLTKLNATFAIGVVAAGVLMGISFAVLIAWPLVEMWGPSGLRKALARFSRPSETVA